MSHVPPMDADSIAPGGGAVGRVAWRGSPRHLARLLSGSDAAPEAVVLVLHGGRSQALTPPPRLNLPAARMRPFSAEIARASRGHRLLVGEVRYRYRGWNGARGDAARDARQALAEVGRTVGDDVPVVLVGHSMGGRAALLVAGHPQVRGVVALAPWCPPGEPVAHLAHRRVVVLHDEHDRVTSAREAWAFLERARQAGARTRAVGMRSGGHAMVRGARAWHRIAVDSVLDMLELPLPPSHLTT
ncbi:alpha/beta fold hydrolase [Streptomyces xanthochromogenes]|uniref:alpha/beta fold hydrolase n=1 Tax=Streptomyces xanthochromogenes TaxID=67384 RepID=UPI0037AB99E0